MELKGYLPATTWKIETFMMTAKRDAKYRNSLNRSRLYMSACLDINHVHLWQE
jgi:hypothetical protein